MNPETKTILKMFAAWQDDREEIWLREQARQGWSLVRLGFGRYTFRRAEPQDMVYRMDYYSTWTKAGRQAYYDLFEQAGWEHVGQLAGWQYFRKPARAGEVDEIYTDNASKIEKHNRLLIPYGVLLMVLASNLFNSIITPYPYSAWRIWTFICLSPIFILLAIAFVRTYQRVRDLKSL